MTTKSTAAAQSFPSQNPRQLILLLGVPIGTVLALLGVAFTGAASVDPVVDPGPVVIRGLPVLRALRDGAAAVTIGLLVVTSFVLPGQRSNPAEASFTQWHATRWATWAAAAWLTAGSALLVFTAASVIGVPISSSTFRTQFTLFAFRLELGQALVVSTVAVLVVFIVLAVTKRVSAIAVATVLSLAALLPLSLSGHAAGSNDHVNAVNSLATHLISVSVWMGGLVAVILLRPKLGQALPTVVSRYSRVALCAVVALTLSGVINASLRLTGPADLVTTPYGLLVAVKTCLLISLGAAGYVHRRHLIPRLAGGGTSRSAFFRLASAEVLLMAAAMGLSAALSQSAPPTASLPDRDARSSLLGFEFPAPVTLGRVITGFHPDWAFLALALLLAIGYVLAVRRLSKAATPWPARRTAAWIGGCLALTFATSGGPAIYGGVAFSTHMIQHLIVMLLVPVLWVLGAPTVLARQTLTPRLDHSRGSREWLLLLTQSRVIRFSTRPAVAGGILVAGFFGFYFSGWFQLSLQTHPGHLLMLVFFLAAGTLFFVSIRVRGGTATTNRSSAVVAAAGTVIGIGVTGFVITRTGRILGETWWHALGRSNERTLLTDQQAGGAVALLAAGLLAATLTIMWHTDRNLRAHPAPTNQKQPGTDV